MGGRGVASLVFYEVIVVINRIVGYVVVCDRCGRKEMYYDNPDFKSAEDIENEFLDFKVKLILEGWRIAEGKVLCPECAVKAGQG